MTTFPKTLKQAGWTTRVKYCNCFIQHFCLFLSEFYASFPLFFSHINMPKYLKPTGYKTRTTHISDWSSNLKLDPKMSYSVWKFWYITCSSLRAFKESIIVHRGSIKRNVCLKGEFILKDSCAHKQPGKWLSRAETSLIHSLGIG